LIRTPCSQLCPSVVLHPCVSRPRSVSTFFFFFFPGGNRLTARKKAPRSPEVELCEPPFSPVTVLSVPQQRANGCPGRHPPHKTLFLFPYRGFFSKRRCSSCLTKVPGARLLPRRRSIFLREDNPPGDFSDFLSETSESFLKEGGRPVFPPLFSHEFWVLPSLVERQTSRKATPSSSGDPPPATFLFILERAVSSFFDCGTSSGPFRTASTSCPPCSMVPYSRGPDFFFFKAVTLSFPDDFFSL